MKTKRTKKWIFLGLGLVALVLLALVLGACILLSGPAKKLEHHPETLAVPATEPEIILTEAPEPVTEATEPPKIWKGDYLKNILLIGQAYRYGEDTKLADSIILATIDPKNSTVTLTSFLRDTYVQLPTYAGRVCGKNRINVIYNLGWRWEGTYGGMEMMDLCLEETFGVHVDHNIEVGFETFYEIIDTLGGIDVEVTEEEAAYLLEDITGMNDHIKPGMNHMNGYTALCYARMRKIDSDVERSDRQRKVISIILEKCREMDLRDLKNLISTVVPMVITDMSPAEILELTGIVIPMLPDLKIETATCPAEDTYWWQTIDILGYPSDVIRFREKPNREALIKRCEPPVDPLKAP